MAQLVKGLHEDAILVPVCAYLGGDSTCNLTQEAGHQGSSGSLSSSWPDQWALGLSDGSCLKKNAK